MRDSELHPTAKDLCLIHFYLIFDYLHRI